MLSLPEQHNNRMFIINEARRKESSYNELTVEYLAFQVECSGHVLLPCTDWAKLQPVHHCGVKDHDHAGHIISVQLFDYKWRPGIFFARIIWKLIRAHWAARSLAPPLIMTSQGSTKVYTALRVGQWGQALIISFFSCLFGFHWCRYCTGSGFMTKYECAF